MQGQGGRLFMGALRLSILTSSVVGSATGAAAVLNGDPSLWRIADLFFDVTLLLTLIFNRRALFAPAQAHRHA